MAIANSLVGRKATIPLVAKWQILMMSLHLLRWVKKVWTAFLILLSEWEKREDEAEYEKCCKWFEKWSRLEGKIPFCNFLFLKWGRKEGRLEEEKLSSDTEYFPYTKWWKCCRRWCQLEGEINMLPAAILCVCACVFVTLNVPYLCFSEWHFSFLINFAENFEWYLHIFSILTCWCLECIHQDDIAKLSDDQNRDKWSTKMHSSEVKSEIHSIDLQNALALVERNRQTLVRICFSLSWKTSTFLCIW